MEKADALRFALTGGDFRTEIFGSHQLVLEGADGVLELTAERIGFRCGRREVWVTGTALTLLRVEASGAAVTGRISEVAFR